MRCENGHELDAGARFCPTCGIAVAGQPAAAAETRSAAGGGLPGRRRPLIFGAAALVLVAAVVAGVLLLGGDDESADSSASPAGQLRQAYEECETEDGSEYLLLTDEGRTVLIDTEDEYNDTAALDCFLNELGTSQSVRARMSRTTAMMGAQDAAEDGYEYSWTYHPDNGINMVVEAADEG